MFKFLTLVLFLSYISQYVNGQCWIPSYGRGVGKVLNSCPSGYEQNGKYNLSLYKFIIYNSIYL